MDKQKADFIITEYLQKIYGFAVKKAFSYDEAEELCADIVQEVYLSLLKSEEVVNVEGYIWRISENTYSRYVSFKKRNEGISLDGLYFTDIEGGAGGMEIPFYEDFSTEDSYNEVMMLRREIGFLTEKRREIVYLFYYKDKSISYISKRLGIPEGTVKWHLNKARNELKEGFHMERKIGKLGLSPIIANDIGHSGDPGTNGGPEFYLGDKINLNIVYSVYFSPKTKEEIAEELGMTLVFIEDKINFLENNGFLVRTTGNRFTTYVKFEPATFSMELCEQKLKKQLEIAEMLVKEYVPDVRKAIADMDEVYIPGGNRQLLEAAVIFYGVLNYCGSTIKKDLSKYVIRPTEGGRFIAFVALKAEQSDPDYIPTLKLPFYWACGNMNRTSGKYPAVSSWSVDTRYCSRQGAWKNNLTADYDYLYEFMTGTISDNAASAEKFDRLRERRFLTEDNQINIMVVKGKQGEFFDRIPRLEEKLKDKFANFALEAAMMEAKDYPPQMQDLVIDWSANGFLGAKVALMVMDILYGNGTFGPLTEREKVTSQLIMFSDVLPD